MIVSVIIFTWAALAGSCVLLVASMVYDVAVLGALGMLADVECNIDLKLLIIIMLSD